MEDRMSTKAQEVALDRILVDRFKNGDASAFDEMVSRYWDRIFSMTNQLLRNAQDAEEVTQDAFIRAHKGLANFRGGGLAQGGYRLGDLSHERRFIAAATIGNRG